MHTVYENIQIWINIYNLIHIQMLSYIIIQSILEYSNTFYNRAKLYLYKSVDRWQRTRETLVDHPWKVRIDRRVRCTKKAARTTRAKINLHATSRRRCLFTYPRLLFPSAFPREAFSSFSFRVVANRNPPKAPSSCSRRN